MANPFTNVIKQLTGAARGQKLPEGLFEYLKKPQRVIQLAVPLKMDNGKTKIFDGWRIGYNQKGVINLVNDSKNDIDVYYSTFTKGGFRFSGNHCKTIESLSHLGLILSDNGIKAIR